MNAMEKPPAAANALVLVDGLTPDKVYGTPEATGLKAILKRIEDEVRSTIIDVSSEAGREAAKSVAYKVARSKTALDDMGKSLVEHWKKSAKAVDAERKTIRDTLDGLKAEVLKPVEDWEAAEQARVAGHIGAITAIEDLERVEGEESSTAISARLAKLSTAADRDFQEFAGQAATAIEHALHALNAHHHAALKREADRAELEQLRAKVAEQDRKERERLAAEEAAAKAEQDRIAAATAEEARKARDEQIAREATERAVAAAEAERKRQADAEAAAQAARENNKRHRAKVIDAAVSALVAAGVDEDSASMAIDAIVEGKVPNVAVSF